MASLLPALSLQQTNAVLGTMCASSCISIIGSSLICFHVLVGKKYRKPLHRLLLGLSLSDIMTSLRFAILGPVLYPMEEPSGFCTADGFLAVLGYTGPYYNAAISFYYVLSIKYGIRDERIQKVYEPIFHGVSILYALGFALAGLGLEVYNPTPVAFGCWIDPYPPECTDNEEIECERGEKAPIFAAFAAMIPLLVVLFTLIVNNLIVYMFVRKTDLRSQRYSMRTSSRQPTSENFNEANTDSDQLSNNCITICCGSKQEGPNLSQKVATQSFFYVFAFFICYIMSTVLFALGAVDPEGSENGDYFIWNVLNAFLLPLQGLLNFLVFVRPRYVRWRKCSLTRLHAFRMAAFTLQNPEDYTRKQPKRPIRITNTADEISGGISAELTHPGMIQPTHD